MQAIWYGADLQISELKPGNIGLKACGPLGHVGSNPIPGANTIAEDQSEEGSLVSLSFLEKLHAFYTSHVAKSSFNNSLAYISVFTDVLTFPD
ncbi:hypothetical protein KAU87_05725 [Candidatus Bathyarchaeota archaeon]|nr:hypothetical protein [Candidatus Bathyarchaeota archaeon]